MEDLKLSNQNSNNNHYSNTNYEIPLKLSENLEKEGIIQKFVKDIRDNSVKLVLNSVYHPIVSIRVPIDIITSETGGWTLFIDTLRNELRNSGVNNQNHILEIHITLNNNIDLICELNKSSTITITDHHDGDEDDEQDNNKKEEEKTKETIPQVLIKLALANSTLFKDEFNSPHALVKIKDYYEVLPVEATKFKRYLSKLYYDSEDGNNKKIAGTEVLNSVVHHLQADAEFDGKTIPLHLRTAWANSDTKDAIYYDMSDEKRRCIKVTKDGWKIVDNQIEVLFKRYNHLKPQVEPTIRTTTTITKLDDTDDIDSKMFDVFTTLFNVKKKDQNNTLLLKCYIISLFIPDIPKPVLVLHGEQGGAKSTFQELIKMLVDPSTTQTFTFPRDSNEFIQQLSHNYIVYYDNVSVIQDWVSDLLCRAVTGSSFSKRALWTNDEDFYYNFKRNLGINGIDLAATKADLLDRSILMETDRIDKAERIKIQKIWDKFNEIKPQVLGYIFDILAKVLRYKEQHGEIDFPGGLNRMADWEEYAEIISRCMGIADGEFQRVYAENIGIQVDEAIASSPLSMTVIELMSDKTTTWTGTPTQLFETLNEIAETKLKINTSKIKIWPKSASYLSRRLNSIRTNLREKGIEIKTGDKDSQDKRLITISKVPSVASVPSKTDKSSTNQPQKVDGTENDDNVPSKLPSTNNEEFQAQNTDSRQHDSIDGTLHTGYDGGISEKQQQEEGQEEPKVYGWNSVPNREGETSTDDTSTTYQEEYEDE